jgi:hypothetical protein
MSLAKSLEQDEGFSTTCVSVFVSHVQILEVSLANVSIHPEVPLVCLQLASKTPRFGCGFGVDEL